VTPPVNFRSFSQGDGPVSRVAREDQAPLSPPFDKLEEEPWIVPLADDVRRKFACLDDTIVLNIPKPTSPAEEERLVGAFLSGLRKLFSKADNWTFLQCLPYLRGKWKERALSSVVPVGNSSSYLLQVHQGRLDLRPRRHRAQLADRHAAA